MLDEQTDGGKNIQNNMQIEFNWSMIQVKQHNKRSDFANKQI